MQKFLRQLGWVEGSSLLLLMFIAMPLKYVWGMPEAVRAVGAIHGGLYVAYVLAALGVGLELGWSFRRILGAWAVATVPFGPFVFDRKLFPAE
jgi:integral membrane protein